MEAYLVEHKSALTYLRRACRQYRFRKFGLAKKYEEAGVFWTLMGGMAGSRVSAEILGCYYLAAALELQQLGKGDDARIEQLMKKAAVMLTEDGLGQLIYTLRLAVTGKHAIDRSNKGFLVALDEWTSASLTTRFDLLLSLGLPKQAELST